MDISAIAPAFGIVLLGLAVEAVCSESELRGDRAVIVQAVVFDGVVGPFFEEGRDVGDHIPWPHEPIEIYVIHCFHFGSFSRTSTKDGRSKNDEQKFRLSAHVRTTRSG